MSGYQEYFCQICGYNWESLDAPDCPQCRKNKQQKKVLVMPENTENQNENTQTPVPVTLTEENVGSIVKYQRVTGRRRGENKGLLVAADDCRQQALIFTCFGKKKLVPVFYSQVREVGAPVAFQG